MLTMAEETKDANYSLSPAWGFVPAGSDQALKALVAAVIGQAARDARLSDQKGQDARAWLLGEDCAIFSSFIGLDHNAVKSWVMAGCPAAPILVADKRKRKGVA
jgi:hypothetical protein